MYRLRNIVLFMVVALSVWGCKEDVKEIVKFENNPETTPTIISRDVVTLVSDSGVTLYRISAKLWNIFEEAEKPFWNFPEGLLLEKLDDNFETEAYIKSDSATYFKLSQMWRLDGHVTIINSLKEMMLTQQIYWDQRQKKVYSDSFIHIEQSSRIVEGYGFNSNENMTTYEVNKVSGIFPVENLRQRRDSVDTKTGQVNKE